MQAHRGLAAGPRPLVASQRSSLRLATSSLNRPRRVACAAAEEDPYVVLGIQPGVDQNEINRAYGKLKYNARSNEAALKRIESAHSRLMLMSLNSRMKGQGVAKDIKYADQEPLFPWRPKRGDATPKIMSIVGAVQLALAAFAFQAPSMTKIVACMLVGIAGNIMKQNAIFPGPKDPEFATEEEAARPGKNVVRGILLGLMATFFATAIMSVPELAIQVFRNVLPSNMLQPSLLISLKVAGAALSNWVMTSFYY